VRLRLYFFFGAKKKYQKESSGLPSFTEAKARRGAHPWAPALIAKLTMNEAN